MRIFLIIILCSLIGNLQASSAADNSADIFNFFNQKIEGQEKYIKALKTVSQNAGMLFTDEGWLSSKESIAEHGKQFVEAERLAHLLFMVHTMKEQEKQTKLLIDIKDLLKPQQVSIESGDSLKTKS
ncbi:MAG: hypothetical protein P4L31_06505 [Candidatus Babeliales bacterium]|nr:hypothetical protein [Candidatus Babeliales bacterium]